MLRLIHRLMDIAQVYRVAQLCGRPTVERYRACIRKHVPQDPRRRILEIGCGVGSSRPLFDGDYIGIDINPDYIRTARQRLGGEFQVMDAAKLSFEPGTFDDAVSIATAHHLSDEELCSMVRQATKVAPVLHLIDAILPVSPNARFKYALFRIDRGRHVRTFEQLREIIGRNANIQFCEVLEGPLHDVCYIRASHLPAPAATGIDAVGP